MSKVAIVIGGAQGVWEELESALGLVKGRDFIVIATNHAGRLYAGHIDAWVTLHPECLREWRSDRKDAGFNDDYEAFVHENRRGLIDVQVVPHGWYASSGIYAAQVATQALDCAGVILCGVPLEEERGHIAFPGPWIEWAMYRAGAEAAKADGTPIRSMSGWTADLFGQPTKAWLKQIGVGKASAKLKPQNEEATMRVRMLRTRNFTPRDDRRVTYKYEAEKEFTVRREWGDEMVTDGDAEEIDAPARDVDADAG